jgi:hypothetical protein
MALGRPRMPVGESSPVKARSGHVALRSRPCEEIHFPADSQCNGYSMSGLDGWAVIHQIIMLPMGE